MQAFDLDISMVDSHFRFSRSFIKVSAPVLEEAIDAEFAGGHTWPGALPSINPHFEKGKTTTERVSDGMIAPETAHVFRMDGQVIAFHTYQTEAIAKGNSKKSSFVTTGLGSGHLAAATCGDERVAVVRPNHHAASRVSQCAF
jgi:hypothetical protein